jgi:hypothetical protein
VSLTLSMTISELCFKNLHIGDQSDDRLEMQTMASMPEIWICL